ncbi:dynein axonemal heavy chain 5-like, partial [Saccostrea cucullata]|uniref:dynein axonemal heavy chain 5-like n=1 Tax=Saccostrea cuccullata TaxID=36930 RepID=UPI002ED405C0
MSGIKGVNFSQYSVNPSAMAHGPAYLPSEGIIKDVIIRDAVSVSSSDGEMVLLHDKVCLNDGVEVWLQRLRDSVAKTLRELNISIIQDCNNGVMMDEWASKYPAQVCRIGMLYYWTRECDAGIGELKYDRKALQHNTMKKYQASTAKLTTEDGAKMATVLTKGAWRTLEDPMLPLHKARLESMIAQSLYLRDVLENMCNRKSLREPTDFEWRRCIRCYFHPVASSGKQNTRLSLS